jgi:hypothetical protein
MRAPILLSLLCAMVTIAFAQERKTATAPNEFILGHRTFIDVGPPFNYYDLFVVRAIEDGASIEEIALTPNEGSCLYPAKIEIRSAVVKDSVASLLNGNPCDIPEKKLRRELKRCKHCLVFSGADVAMEVQCRANTRIIRSTILDRDWFDHHPDTPQHTSQTMELLAKLEKATGPEPIGTIGLSRFSGGEAHTTSLPSAGRDCSRQVRSSFSRCALQTLGDLSSHAGEASMGTCWAGIKCARATPDIHTTRVSADGANRPNRRNCYP